MVRAVYRVALSGGKLRRPVTVALDELATARRWNEYVIFRSGVVPVPEAFVRWHQVNLNCTETLGDVIECFPVRSDACGNWS